MENQELIKQVTEKAEKWLTPAYDAETQAEVKRMLENDDKTELIEAFYKDLEFGTGGLRGIMGVGSNRMNIYTVGAATQGLSNYLKKNFKDLPQISVVVGHDCRNNSRLFAETSANIFSANGIKVYLFDDMRPTPEMSFAIRHLGCQSGIILTASHNPKEYNGYKAYWDDGAQVLAPHDKGIIDEVNAIASAADIKFQGNPDLIQIIGEDIDKVYLDMVKTVSIDPEAIARHKDMKIVYTPIHGTGMMLIPRALKMWGFENVFTVPEQMIKDGNFPTVISPNPENAEALSMAVNLAKEIDADLVMASDPDADRVKNVLTHPCLVGVYIGMFLMATQLQLPGVLKSTVTYIGNCNSALTMFIIGTILTDVKLREIINPTALKFSVLRLFLLPLLAYGISLVAGLDPVAAGVAVIMTGMPAGATAAIFAARYDSDAPFAAKTVVLTTLISMITIPAWCLFIG